MAIGKIFKQALKEWWNSSPLSAGAAVAFYAVFSIPSAFILVIIFARPLLSPDLVQHSIITDIARIIGKDTADFIQALVINLRRSQGTGIPEFVSTLGLIFGSVGVFSQLQMSLNKMWHASPKVGKSWRAWILGYVVAFLIIIFFGALVTLSLTIGLIWSLVGPILLQHVSDASLIIGSVNVIQFVIIITISFAVIYAYLPHVRVSFTAALLGGLLGTVFMAIGREIIALYLRWSAQSTAYGAASALVLVLLWVYYSSQIFFYGAALTYVIDRKIIKE